MQPTPSTQSAKFTERIKAKAFAFLEQHPEGLRYTELKAQIQAADSKFNSNTINGCIWNLDAAFPDRVYKPSKGRPVEEGGDGLHQEMDAWFPPSAIAGAISMSFSLEGGRNQARMWKTEMMAVVKKRNRLIHQMPADFDPQSAESCERLCTELDAQRESILRSYAHLASLVSTIKTGYKELAEACDLVLQQDPDQCSNHA